MKEKYLKKINNDELVELYEISNSMDTGIDKIYYCIEDDVYIIGSWWYRLFTIKAIIKKNKLLYELND